jgi:hypothetical protein
MASDLRRLVVLGPNGTITPGSSQDYRQAGNRTFFAETGTRWARMWADWFTLMPARGQFDPARLQSLDEQIALARRDGLRLILTLYRFPLWANGTENLTPEQVDATLPDRIAQGGNPAQAKALNFRYPEDVAPDSDWGQFVDFIAGRYSRGNPGRPSLDATIDVLEICNEPNLQWWPQQGSSNDPANRFGPGDVIVQNVVARMFASAQTIVNRYGGEPVLGGPGVADFLEVTRLRTGYRRFADLLLAALTAAGFEPGPRFTWTHHNYSDVTFDQGPGSTSPDTLGLDRTVNYAAEMRARLRTAGWAGWPAADPADPWIMLTEGGVTIQSIRNAQRWNIADAAAQRAKQAELLRRSWDRMTSPTDGAGIAVAGQYLWYTDPNFDSGLCDTLETGGAVRPAYSAWGGLPSFA